jgi:ABC-type transporter Mla MlaB component
MIAVRAARADATSMPPMQLRTVDSAGITLLSDWINGLASCN